MTGSALLQTVGLVKRFPVRRGGLLGRTAGDVHAVSGVDLHVAAGETLGLVGESGSGKSTLARLVMRLLDPTAGTVLWDGTDVTGLSARALAPMRRNIQMVFQDPYASLNPRHTVGQLVAAPLRVHRMPGDHRRRVGHLLRQVGLDDAHHDMHPHRFSGGQRQRIAIARALALRPRLVVLDEPVSALDVSVQAQILTLLADLRAGQGLAYLFISHDLGVVRHVSDRVAVMYAGRIVECGPRDDVLDAPRHPYTAALVAAAPGAVGGGPRRPRAVAAGEPPSPLAPPPGCAFVGRCPVARDLSGEDGSPPRECRTMLPPLTETAAGHTVGCWHPHAAPAPAAAGAGPGG